MSAVATTEVVQGGIVKMAQCIPTNDLFTGILSQPLGLVTGGLGGLLDWLVILAAVILALFAIVRIIRARRAHEDISAIFMVMIVPVILALGIAVFRGAMAAIGNMC